MAARRGAQHRMQRAAPDDRQQAATHCPQSAAGNAAAAMTRMRCPPRGRHTAASAPPADQLINAKVRRDGGPGCTSPLQARNFDGS